MATRIKEKYINEAVPALQQKFGYKNVNEIPSLVKIVINMGLGDCKDNPKALEAAVKELEAIAGQKAITTKAKKSIEKERVAAIADLQRSVADLSVSVAGRLIGEDLSDDDQRKLIEKYVAEAGNLNAN